MKRALLLLNTPVIPNPVEIKKLSEVYDEFIVVLIWETFQFCVENKQKPGDILIQIKNSMERMIAKPVYLFPIHKQNMDTMQLILRLGHYCPDFAILLSNSKLFINYAPLVYHVPVKLIACNELPLESKTHKTRALFVSRAQPFHNGHKEFITSILSEYDEVIFIIACADKSFNKANPATAGERMSMIKAYLEINYSNRYWIIPMAYNPFTAENFKEIKLLLPHFNVFFSTNPSAIEMAQYENIQVEIPTITTETRGTILRQSMANNECIKKLIPSETYAEMKRLNIDQRIIKLNKK